MSAGAVGNTRQPRSFFKQKSKQKSGLCPPFSFRKKEKTQTSSQCLSFQVEAPSRLELESEAFAELCLTTWLWRRFGAVDEIRTRDIHLGKVALYH